MESTSLGIPPDETNDCLSDVMARLTSLTDDVVADPELKNVEQAVQRIEPHLPPKPQR